jgi:hypothetical protein
MTLAGSPIHSPIRSPIFSPLVGKWGAATNSAPKFIIDSDFAGDCDDAAALAVAIAAHRAGTINLLGVVISSTIDTSAPGARALLDIYGMQVPLYAYQGATGTYNNNYSSQLSTRFGINGESRTAYASDVTGYRTMLAAAPNASVVIIGIGGLTALSALLNSTADGISALTGAQLVAAKVTKLVQMAGTFPTSGGSPEYNMTRDITASQNVFTNWPTPIVSHGSEIGATVFCGPDAGTDPLIDPVRYAFDLCGVAGLLTNGKRQSWDPLAVLYAIYGATTNFGFGGQNGTITIDGSGNSLWTSTSGTRSYVSKVASDAALGAQLDAVMLATLPATKYTVKFPLTEGAGEFSADAGYSVSKLYRGTGIADTTEPVWTDLGGGAWVYAFDGTNDFSSALYLPRFNSQNIVFGVIAKLTSNTGSRVLMCREDGATPNSRWNFRNNGGKLELIVRTDTSNTAIVLSSPSASDVPTGTWMMLTGKALGTSVAVRKNGVDLVTATNALPIAATGSTDRILVGARRNTSAVFADFFVGQIAAAEFISGAVAADLTTMETALRAIAAAKSITIP